LTVEEQIHLVCTNKTCAGKMKKRLLTCAKALDIKGIGPATIEKIL